MEPEAMLQGRKLRYIESTRALLALAVKVFADDAFVEKFVESLSTRAAFDSFAEELSALVGSMRVGGKHEPG